MTYAFSMANGVWMRGLEGLTLGVGLKGNGMCFSSRGLRRFPWRAYGLVEDMEFALMLRSHGERVRFEPRALVFGEMVSKGGAGAVSQRRRWEAGRRSLPGKFAGPIARSAHLGVARKMAYLIDLYFSAPRYPGNGTGTRDRRICRRVAPGAHRPPDPIAPRPSGGDDLDRHPLCVESNLGHGIASTLSRKPGRSSLLSDLESHYCGRWQTRRLDPNNPRASASRLR